MKAIIWIVSLAAIGLALSIAVAGPGSRLGWWDYSDGLKIIREAGQPVTIAAIASFVAFIVSMIGARGLAPVALVGALLAGAASVTPIMMKQDFEANPFIHDVTTDFDNPPQIISGANEKRVNPPEYLGDEIMPRSSVTVANAQRAAFPDIRPIETPLGTDEAGAAALKVIKSMGLKLLSDTETEEGRLIEAAYTSFWFGFIDDFIVRIEPDGDGAILNVRSKSRVGGSDLGANAKRIREFSAEYKSLTNAS